MADMDLVPTSSSTATNDSELSTPIVDEGSYMLAVTERGYGKRISLSEFKTQRRGGMGVIAMKFKAKAGGGGAKTRKLG